MCMRTTLNLSDTLMSEAKQHAAATGRTLTSIVEAALRELLDREKRAASARHELEWTVVQGGTQPSVDLADRDALVDQMERGPARS